MSKLLNEKDTLETKEGNISQLAKELHAYEKMATSSKELLNSAKIQLGINLVILKELYKDHKVQSQGSWENLLQKLQLNTRRTHQLIKNAEFLLDKKVPVHHYQHLDSSVIELFRLKDKNPTDFIHDIKTLKYSDLVISCDQLSE